MPQLDLCLCPCQHERTVIGSNLAMPVNEIKNSLTRVRYHRPKSATHLPARRYSHAPAHGEYGIENCAHRIRQPLVALHGCGHARAVANAHETGAIRFKLESANGSTLHQHELGKPNHWIAR